MDAAEAFERFLSTDPRDAGCDAAWALIHRYAELVALGEDPEVRHPGVTAHLAACGPCADDFQGLLAALSVQTTLLPDDVRPLTDS
ncbi:MAG: hypothetical protein ABIO16_11930 [Nocardioides sp.]